MMTHYVSAMREKSNRTFHRILSALPSEVAQRYGQAENQPSPEKQLKQAVEAKD
jgi:hypothetical protein